MMTLPLLLLGVSASPHEALPRVAAAAAPRGGDNGSKTCGAARMGATGAWLATHPAASACGLLEKNSCEAQCRKNPRCLAWQWMQPTPGAEGGATCYLKSEAGLEANGGSTAEMLT